MSGKIPVSIITISLNEEANIALCLESLKRFDEVWVVDSNSTDRTREIAEEMGATVVTCDWNRQYPMKKQWAFENLPFAHKWVMLVDADEQIPEARADEIGETLKRDGDKHAGYFVGLYYQFAGELLKRGQRIYKLALMQHAKTRRLSRRARRLRLRHRPRVLLLADGSQDARPDPPEGTAQLVKVVPHGTPDPCAA